VTLPPAKSEKRVVDVGRVKVKATFNLPADVHHLLKLEAVVRKRPMVDLLQDALRVYLDHAGGNGK
jgi:hypothetical protein